jgi:16S rRNA (uracil1498-N3)-methyltransferase
MSRFYLPPEQCQGPVLTLTDREAHHAVHVLRLQRGDPVTVLDGVGHEFLCEVQDASRSQLNLRIREKRSASPLPCQITLLQALPKAKLIESIIQKATELGAARIVPLLSERVVTRIDDEGAAHKTAKWQWVAVDAIKQCGSPWLPRVEAPVTPQQFLQRKEQCELPLVASLPRPAQHPRQYFRTFQQQHGRLPVSACVWVGPEGDFTPEELDLILASGAQPITLGPLVLRAETAAIYCLSVLSYELHAPQGGMA